MLQINSIQLINEQRDRNSNIKSNVESNNEIKIVSTNNLEELVSKTSFRFPTILNTRNICSQFEVTLVKNVRTGLGFSITTRDNHPDLKTSHIYVKSIMSNGPAIENSLIKSGDLILKVNEQELTGLSQDEVVDLLRSLQVNSEVKLLLGRQQSNSEEYLTKNKKILIDSSKNDKDKFLNDVSQEAQIESFHKKENFEFIEKNFFSPINSKIKLNSQYNKEQSNNSLSRLKNYQLTNNVNNNFINANCTVLSTVNCNQLNINKLNNDIKYTNVQNEFIKPKCDNFNPNKFFLMKFSFNLFLHNDINLDARRSNIGITIKQRNLNCSNDSKENLFVKFIVPGGLAEMDGRLKPNDQLYSVNGFSMIDLPKGLGMSILREALNSTIDITGNIELIIMRFLDIFKDEYYSSRKSLSTQELNNNDYSKEHDLKKLSSKFRTHRNISYNIANRDNVFEDILHKPTFYYDEKFKFKSLENLYQRDEFDDSECFNGEIISTFARNALNRQSMSEKRNAFVNPEKSDIYQQVRHKENFTPNALPDATTVNELCGLSPYFRTIIVSSQKAEKILLMT